MMETTTTKKALARYPEYKDSGVDWLGEIPVGWEVLANRHIFKLKKNLVGKKSSEYVLLSLTLNGVIKRDITFSGDVLGRCAGGAQTPCWIAKAPVKTSTSPFQINSEPPREAAVALLSRPNRAH